MTVVGQVWFVFGESVVGWVLLLLTVLVVVSVVVTGVLTKLVVLSVVVTGVFIVVTKLVVVSEGQVKFSCEKRLRPSSDGQLPSASHTRLVAD